MIIVLLEWVIEECITIIAVKVPTVAENEVFLRNSNLTKRYQKDEN